MTRFGLGLCFAALLACGGTSAENSWKAMNSAACSGDVAEFFSHMDEQRVIDAYVRRDPRMPTVTTLVVTSALSDWRKDVQRGEEGNWCRGQFRQADNVTGRVWWTTPSGRVKLAMFEDRGERWVMVDVVGADPQTLQPML